MARVVISGVGLVSNVGDGAEAVHRRMCEAAAGFAPPTLFDPGTGAPCAVAEIAGFTPSAYLGSRNVRPLDRTGRLAAAAAHLALGDAGFTPTLRAGGDIGIVLGTVFGGMHTIGEFDRRGLREGPEYVSPLDFANTVFNAAAGQAAIWHKLEGPNSTIAAGETSGAYAIGYAARAIRDGRAAALVAGGADELSFESYLGCLQADLLQPPDRVGDPPKPYDRRRAGFVPGEGAAVLVVESDASARTRGVRILGSVDGVGLTYEPHMDGGSRAEALTDAIRSALDEAGITGAELALVSGSANGSPSVDADEARGLELALARRVPVTAVKSITGETFGAGGAMQAILALESLRRGVLPGIVGFEAPDPSCTLWLAPPGAHRVSGARALVTSVASDGHCCALVLSSTE